LLCNGRFATHAQYSSATSALFAMHQGLLSLILVCLLKQLGDSILKTLWISAKCSLYWCSIHRHESMQYRSKSTYTDKCRTLQKYSTA